MCKSLQLNTKFECSKVQASVTVRPFVVEITCCAQVRRATCALSCCKQCVAARCLCVWAEAPLSVSLYEQLYEPVAAPPPETDGEALNSVAGSERSRLSASGYKSTPALCTSGRVCTAQVCTSNATLLSHFFYVTTAGRRSCVHTFGTGSGEESGTLEPPKLTV